MSVVNGMRQRQVSDGWNFKPVPKISDGKGIQVTLSMDEIDLAARAGFEMHLRAIKKGFQPTRGRGKQYWWQVHIEGSLGEAVIAKLFGIPWDGNINSFTHIPDVGPFQVRTSTMEDYDLVVRDKDKDGDIFIHVNGEAPTYTVVGWIYGRDARRPEWRKNYGGYEAAFFVPHEELNDIRDLLQQFKRT